MNMLTVSPSPHIKSKVNTSKIMGLVILALLPTIIASGIIFGTRAILVVAFSAATAVWQRTVTAVSASPAFAAAIMWPSATAWAAQNPAT